MFNRADLVYQYDGSFDGLLCCVFESYEQKEIPADILSPDAVQTMLLPAKQIITDPLKADRVLLSVPKKMGADALDFVRHAFLTCLPQKELYILLFMQLGYRYGSSVMDMLTDDVVNTLFKAVKHLNNESHLLKGFVRFSVINGALAAEIEPKNFVLPLITQHFCERFPEENFLIYDKAHGMALIYQPYRAEIIPIEALELPDPDEEEQAFRELWRLFYDTIEIEGRHNPKCRMSHMPKRYWNYMTEFARPQKSAHSKGEDRQLELPAPENQKNPLPYFPDKFSDL